MSTTNTKGKRDLYALHCVIGIGLTFGVGLIPPFEPITQVGMQILGIFLGLIYMWSTLGTLWPSLVGILAIGLSEYTTMKGAVAASLGNQTAVLALFAIILFGLIQHVGIAKYIARWFLTRKMINGRPMVFTFIFFLATYVLAALNANILPVIFLMWPILYSILEEVGYKKGDRYTTIMVIGTIFAAVTGQPAKPFVGAPSIVVGSFETATGLQVDVLSYMIYGVIMAVIGIAAFVLMIKFIFRPDVEKMKCIDIEKFKRDHLPAMNKKQKIVAATLAIYLGFIILPSILPTSIWFVGILDKLGACGITIAMTVGLIIFRLDGQPILNFKEIVAKYVNWDIVFLVATALLISDALTHESTGIKPFLAELLNPILGGRSVVGFTVILIIFAVLITNVANNAVMGAVLMPVIAIFAEQNGANVMAVAMIVNFALFIAILTPAASPFAAILYSNTEWVEKKDIFKYGSAIVILNILIFIFIGTPIANLIFK